LEFTFFWVHGVREVAAGTDVAKAFASLGYDPGAMKALDFYMPGDNHNYVFNEISRTWIRKPTDLEALIMKMDAGHYVP
jgi:hypothetical protein